MRVEVSLCRSLMSSSGSFPIRFSSAISACEKCGQWRTALDLLEQMVRSILF